MGIKEYFSSDLRTTLVYAALGIIAGYVSFVLNDSRVAFVAMLVILGLSTAMLKYALKTNYRWFLSNGIFVFIFIWFVVWTIFYNLNVVV